MSSSQEALKRLKELARLLEEYGRIATSLGGLSLVSPGRTPQDVEREIDWELEQLREGKYPVPDSWMAWRHPPMGSGSMVLFPGSWLWGEVQRKIEELTRKSDEPQRRREAEKKAAAVTPEPRRQVKARGKLPYRGEEKRLREILIDCGVSKERVLGVKERIRKGKDEATTHLREELGRARARRGGGGFAGLYRYQPARKALESWCKKNVR